MLRKIGLGLLISAFGCTAAFAGASLQQRYELEQKVRKYQVAKDCGSMLGLFYTEGMDKPRKKAFTKTIEDYLCRNMGPAFASVAFQGVPPDKQKPPGDFNGKPSAYTLPPLGVIMLDYGPGGPDVPRSLSFFYGLHDGKAWLVTTKNADAK